MNLCKNLHRRQSKQSGRAREAVANHNLIIRHKVDGLCLIFEHADILFCRSSRPALATGSRPSPRKRLRSRTAKSCQQKVAYSPTRTREDITGCPFLTAERGDAAPAGKTASKQSNKKLSRQRTNQIVTSVLLGCTARDPIILFPDLKKAKFLANPGEIRVEWRKNSYKIYLCHQSFGFGLYPPFKTKEQQMLRSISREKKHKSILIQHGCIAGKNLPPPPSGFGEITLFRGILYHPTVKRQLSSFFFAGKIIVYT